MNFLMMRPYEKYLLIFKKTQENCTLSRKHQKLNIKFHHEFLLLHQARCNYIYCIGYVIEKEKVINSENRDGT